MYSVRWHARILALLLMAAGVGSVLYQVSVLHVPLSENETDPVWVVETQLRFDAKPRFPIKVRMFVPPLEERYSTLNESFISNNYGVHVNRDRGNRQVTWSARRADGRQYLYYRLILTPRYANGEQEQVGPQFRNAPELDGAERLAVNALLDPIRQHSADVETFISETIQRVNDLGNDNVRLLLGRDNSLQKRVEVIDLLLAVAHIPVEPVHTLRLADGQGQQPELWLRTYNGEEWLYFNPANGQQGIPEDRLVWWRGPEDLLTLDGGRNAEVSFSVRKSEMSALEMARSLKQRNRSSFMDISLYELPLQSQQLYKVVVMIPLGVLLVLMLRSLVGLETLGTFTPVLIALAFRETQVFWGLLLFVVITALGLLLRSYLEHLRLQLLSRLSVVLTFVVVLMASMSLLGHKLGVVTGLSVGLFPMVILTMVIERLSIVWEERGGSHALKVGVGTMVAAVASHYLMVQPQLSYWFFTLPGLMLCVASIMVLLGHYRGYRLSELLRFKDMTDEGSR
ncbi:MAG: inactive transglutaminase family protein [Pseudomonadota bacterium]